MKTSALTARTIALLIAGGLIAFLAGCSSPDDSAAQSSSTFTPVTITHEYGSATIDAKPTRIVTLTTAWSDTLGALNIPITAQFAAKGYAKYQWSPASNAEVVEVADPTQVTVAEVAKFKPDLILAGYLGSEDQYKKLAEVATTIPVLKKGATADTWESLTTTAGKIFGEQAAAQKVIDETNAKISAFKSEYKGAQGKTFTFAQAMPTGQIGAVNTTDDAAAGLLAQLGFTLNPEVAKQHTAGSTRSRISSERLDLLNSDLLVAYVPGGDFAAVRALPGWSSLTPVRNGTVVYLDDKTQPAFSVPSAPSVEFVINSIKEAAGKL